MTYAEMDKRKVMLPDLLGKPIGFISDKGEMIFPGGAEYPLNHYVFFYPIKEWKEILEIRGEK